MSVQFEQRKSAEQPSNIRAGNQGNFFKSPLQNHSDSLVGRKSIRRALSYHTVMHFLRSRRLSSRKDSHKKTYFETYWTEGVRHFCERLRRLENIEALQPLLFFSYAITLVALLNSLAPLFNHCVLRQSGHGKGTTENDNILDSATVPSRLSQCVLGSIECYKKSKSRSCVAWAFS